MVKKLTRNVGPKLPSDFEWRQIFQAVPLGLVVIDRNLNVIFLNRTFSVISGVTEAETIGRKCYDIFTSPFCQTSDCPMSQIRKGVELLEYEGKNYYNFAKKTPCIVTASPYYGVAGNLAGIVETVTDISTLKQAQNELKSTHERLRKAMGSIIQAISLTIEKRDPYTAGHQRRVTKLCRAIATELGYSWERIQGLRMAAAIHDLGKIHVPAAILNKPGELSEHELAIIRQHPQTAYDILRGIEFPWPLATTVYQHHERLNGSGYPQGLRGKQIVQEARILAVADVSEAMSSFRPYRPKIGIVAAMDEINRGKGVFYDSEIVDICVELFTSKRFDFKVKYKARRKVEASKI
jgi:PAS domain S-box-containing protein